MSIFKRIAAAAMCVPAALSAVPAAHAFAEESAVREVVIDGSRLNTAENMLYRGNGMVSGNNSSRLLLDYKAENPEAYWEIMNYLFGEEGVRIEHLKLEMGSDINSSSGTEPAVKRTEDETANAARGAGYQLAADAKTINPDLTLDMLWWSEPKWVSSAEDVYAARYKWYKETLDAAFDAYGLEFNYVSATQNERSNDPDWIKYLSAALKAEKNGRYDYSKIKLVAGDEVCTWQIADLMMKDEELRDAVDVIGSHYTSWSSENAQTLARDYGKELWFSEASSPMCFAEGVSGIDGSGLGGINGMLDIANRFITMYSGGGMTLCEYQPAVAAYYDGVTYCHKQLILANEPWSGAYKLDSGFYMSLHFSQFIKRGWAFVDGACFGDGTAGGDGHAIVDATYSYMTAADPETGDYSTVITNTTDKPITYSFTVKDLSAAGKPVQVWETRGPDGGAYDENYFRHLTAITPEEKDGAYTYSYEVAPGALVTLSTLEVTEREYTERVSSRLSLPYYDDFEYSGYAEDYLASRGGAPRYTTDEGGAFEVVNVDGNNVLVQQITPEIKANEWGYTPEPTTNLGDDRWFNYSVSAKIKLAGGYAGIGLRYSLADAGRSGYWLKVGTDGGWQLGANKETLESGSLADFDASEWHSLKLEAVDDTVKAFADGQELCTHTAAAGSDLMSAGRAALYSSYDKNSFDELAVEAVEGSEVFVNRYDNTASNVTYAGEWEHTTMSSFRDYKRTSSKGGEGASVSFTFTGTGFMTTGSFSAREIRSARKAELEIDGVSCGIIELGRGSPREPLVSRFGLENTEHTVKLTVQEGSFVIDAIEVISPEAEPQPDESSAGSEAPDTSEQGSAPESTKSSAAGKYIAAAAIAAAAGAAAFAVLRRRKKK